MALQATVLLSQMFEKQNQTIFLHPFSLSLFLLSLFLLLWLNSSSRKKTINLPPSPPRLPIIGHLHLLGSLPHRSLQLLSKQHGPLMLLHLGQIPTLIVSSADMARHIMKTHDVAFVDRPISTASTTFKHGGEDMVFAPYGDYWRQIKKLCVIDLLSAKRVQSYRFIREEEIGNMVAKIKESSLRGKEVNLSDLLSIVTTNIISRIGLGRSLENEKGEMDYLELIRKSMELFGFPSVEDMFPSFGWIDVLTGLRRKMVATSDALLHFFDDVIEEHLVAKNKIDGHAKDFVDLLLDYEQDSSLGVPFTRENLKALLMDIFIAGSDTISITLKWAMAELINHPNVMRRVQEEVRRVVGLGTKTNVDENDLHKMKYLNCVIKETLRLHPPFAMILRRASTINGTIVEGYNTPAKINVMINVWAISRDPNVWDESDNFMPERFVNNGVDFRGQDFEYTPFGAGRRLCPGISFATTSIEFTLASLLYWFDWEVKDVKAIDMTESFGLSVDMKFPLFLVPISHNL